MRERWGADISASFCVFNKNVEISGCPKLFLFSWGHVTVSNLHPYQNRIVWRTTDWFSLTLTLLPWRALDPQSCKKGLNGSNVWKPNAFTWDNQYCRFSEWTSSLSQNSEKVNLCHENVSNLSSQIVISVIQKKQLNFYSPWKILRILK